MRIIPFTKMQCLVVGAILLCALFQNQSNSAEEIPGPVDCSSIHGKVMCGYQGWFRCPDDGEKLGWVHWSRNGKLLEPKSLTFEMWPDMTEYSPEERFAAPGFTYPNGEAATLFSSANPKTVLRHFEWMRDYGIDGAWLQHFAVDLPGGPAQNRYPSRMRVLNNVRAAATKTGRVWALTYDVSGMKHDKIFDVVSADWKKMVDDGVVNDPRYLHEGGKPVVQIFGFYHNNKSNEMSPELAGRLIDFFKGPGPYSAFLYGGGDWDWRKIKDDAWLNVFHRFDAYSPWNVGNYWKDNTKEVHATTNYWSDDKKDCESHNVFWIPVVYPGFSWDNLQQKPAGTSILSRRNGKFYWEQFHQLAKMKIDTVYVAMFDEVDEGTAIFKVTSSPPTQAHFVGLDELPSDYYLRLTGEGIKMLHGKRQVSEELPFKE